MAIMAMENPQFVDELTVAFQTGKSRVPTFHCHVCVIVDHITSVGGFRSYPATQTTHGS